jgi:hypothetical protein
MDKITLEHLISQGLSSHEIAKKMNCGQTNIMYWMKKHNLKTLNRVREQKEKKCPRCQSFFDLSFFYQRRGKIGGSVYCKNCTSAQTVERQKRFKIECVTYKGGCCQSCNYSKSLSALEFHHIDKGEKDFEISRAKLKTFNDSIKKELDKCVLLCANCHREEHDKSQPET